MTRTAPSGLHPSHIIADPARAAALSHPEIAQLMGECESVRSILPAVPAARPVPSPSQVVRVQPRNHLLLDVMAVAERLCYARSHVYTLVKSGEIAAVRHGKEIRVRASAVERFITQHEQTQVVRSLNNMLSKQHGLGRAKASPEDTRPQASR